MFSSRAGEVFGAGAGFRESFDAFIRALLHPASKHPPAAKKVRRTNLIAAERMENSAA
jgi:hypothetical protein